jgi:phage shock protein B
MITTWVGLVLGIVFLVIVAPLWIIAHYLTRWRISRRLSADDEKAMGELWQTARRMEARIDALERLLDAEAPGWRTGTGD